MLNIDEKFLHQHLHKPMGTFPPSQPRYTLTEDMEHMVAYMRETIERLLRFEDKLQKDFTDVSSHLTNDNVIFKETMNNSFTTFLQSVKNEVNDFESNMEASISLFQKDIETNYSNLSEDTAQQIAKNLKDFTDRTTAFEQGITNAFNEYKAELNTTYEDFRQAVESRLDMYNSNYVKSFNDYCTSMNTKLSQMELSFNQMYATFTTEINNHVSEFENAWTKTVEERLDGQDSVIADAVLYMKTNFTASIQNLLDEMKANGEFADIIESEVFSNLENDIKYHGVKVTDYGAKGDGTTDDTASIQEALDSSDIVLFPKGTYIVSQLNINTNNHLIGEGAETVIKQLADTPQYRHAICINNVENVVIEKMCVDGNADNNATDFKHSIYILTSENVAVKDCTIINSSGEGIVVGTTDYLAKNIIIENCEIHDCQRNEICLANCEHVEIKNCKINGGLDTSALVDIEIHTDGDSVKNVVFSDCTFSQNTEPFKILTNGKETSFEGIVFENCLFNTSLNAMWWEDLTFRNCVMYGEFDFAYCQNVTIENCKIKSEKTGLYIYGNSDEDVYTTGIRIINTIIEAVTGIILQASKKALLLGTTIRNCETGLNVFYKNYDITVMACAIFDNTVGVKFSGTTAERNRILNCVLDNETDFENLVKTKTVIDGFVGKMSVINDTYGLEISYDSNANLVIPTTVYTNMIGLLKQTASDSWVQNGMLFEDTDGTLKYKNTLGNIVTIG